jgi:hypothetical protein
MRITSGGSVIVKNATTSGANIQLQSDNGTWAQNDIISNLNTYISDTSGIGARDVAAIKVINDRGGVNTTTSGAMAFYTSPYNNTVTERVRIDSSGRVQIGSSGTPNGNLDVRTAGQSGVPSLGTAGNGINLTRTDGQTGGSIGYTTEGHIYIQSQRFDSASANNLFLQPVGGDVGIGTGSNVASPSQGGASFVVDTNDRRTLLLSTQTTSTNSLIIFYNTNGAVGTIQTSGSSTSYNTSSDYRLKENVVPMEGALDRVDALKPSRFNFIADADKTVDGFLAHEVAEVVPEAISGEKDAVEEYEVTPAVLDDEGNVIEEAVMGTRPVYQGIDQSKLVPLLTAALQEAHTLIKDLTARIETLENQ